MAAFQRFDLNGRYLGEWDQFGKTFSISTGGCSYPALLPIVVRNSIQNLVLRVGFELLESCSFIKLLRYRDCRLYRHCRTALPPLPTVRPRGAEGSKNESV